MTEERRQDRKTASVNASPSHSLSLLPHSSRSKREGENGGYSVVVRSSSTTGSNDGDGITGQRDNGARKEEAAASSKVRCSRPAEEGEVEESNRERRSMDG